jgi:hypothetical protein
MDGILLNDMPIDARRAFIDEIVSNEELDSYADQVTIQDMRDWVARQSDHSACTCPTCMTTIKRYKYTFDKTFLFTLIAMLKVSRENLATIGVDGAYYEQLHHKVRDMVGVNNKNTRFRVMKYAEWGLIEKVDLEDFVYVNVDGRTERRKLGFFRVTDRGKVFLCNRLSIPKTIHVFNDAVFDVGKDTIKLSEVPEISDAEWQAMKKPY